METPKLHLVIKHSRLIPYSIISFLQLTNQDFPFLTEVTKKKTTNSKYLTLYMNQTLQFYQLHLNIKLVGVENINHLTSIPAFQLPNSTLIVKFTKRKEKTNLYISTEQKKRMEEKEKLTRATAETRPQEAQREQKIPSCH